MSKNSREKPQNAVLQIGIATNDKGIVTDVAIIPNARFHSVSGASKSKSGGGGAAPMAIEDTPSVAAGKATGDPRGSKRHAVWGADDKLPNTVLDAIEDVATPANAILINASGLMGQEVIYVKKSDIAAGKGNVQRHYDPVIESFMSRNHALTEFFPAQAFDIATLFNGFSECIFNKGFNKIVQIAHKEAEYSRVSRAVAEFNQLDRQFLYYSGDFSRGKVSSGSYDDPTKVATIPLYDELDFNFLSNLTKKRQPKFAVHSRPRTSRSFHYATMPWQGIFTEKGWVNGVKKVPEIVNAMQDNQISLKYIIYVSEDYFKSIFGSSVWINFTPKERQEKFDEFSARVKSELVGTGNVFTSLTMMCREFNGSIIKSVIFEAVDDRAKNDTWIPTADKGDEQISRAFNVNPTSLGIRAQGASMDRVSGSSNREAQNSQVTMNTWLQRLMLKPYQIAADFNGWDVLFLVDDITHTTTNVQETGIQKSNQALTVGN